MEQNAERKKIQRVKMPSLGSMCLLFLTRYLRTKKTRKNGKGKRDKTEGIAYREKRAPAPVRAVFVLPSLLPFSRSRRTRRPTAT